MQTIPAEGHAKVLPNHSKSALTGNLACRYERMSKTRKSRGSLVSHGVRNEVRFGL